MGDYFGTIYLPWQILHVSILFKNAKRKKPQGKSTKSLTLSLFIEGLSQSIKIKNITTQYKDWGGINGIIWMTSYWATIIPAWVYFIILMN